MGLTLAEDMGGWKAAVYTEEQQKRLGLDELGQTAHPKAAASRFPLHWGAPPRAQTRDIHPLPGGYGMGSSTLAGWIQEKLNEEATVESKGAPAAELVKPVAAGPATETKDHWAELIGAEAEGAVATIRKERPDLLVVMVEADAMVTMDYDERRVRVFVEKGRVARSPLLSPSHATSLDCLFGPPPHVPPFPMYLSHDPPPLGQARPPTAPPGVGW
jgi:hypothetical protein